MVYSLSTAELYNHNQIEDLILLICGIIKNQMISAENTKAVRQTGATQIFGI